MELLDIVGAPTLLCPHSIGTDTIVAHLLLLLLYIDIIMSGGNFHLLLLCGPAVRYIGIK